MEISLHKNAATTPKIRAQIQEWVGTEASAVRHFGLSRDTIRRWRNAPKGDVFDRSHTPHKVQSTLSPQQESVVLAVRDSLGLPLDELHALAKEFLCNDVSRSGVARLLARHKLPSLAEIRKEERMLDPKPKFGTFHAYDPGYIHIDIKYLPVMEGGTRADKTFLYVAIDRATRWVYVEIRDRISRLDAALFLQNVIAACPVKIIILLTDNGIEFTFHKPEKKIHPVDAVCKVAGIEHRKTKPRHPWTNGMVERFNGRIASILATKRFDSTKSLAENLIAYTKCYNEFIPQRALGGISPSKAIIGWKKRKPKLFDKLKLKPLYKERKVVGNHPKPHR